MATNVEQSTPAGSFPPRGAFCPDGWLAAKETIREFAESPGNIGRAASLCEFVSRGNPTERANVEQAKEDCDHHRTVIWDTDEAVPQPELPQALIATVARLRAFAVLLCLNEKFAEELTAVTLLRASVGMTFSSIDLRFSTWLFARLRSYYYGECASCSSLAAQQAHAIWLSRDSQFNDTLAVLAGLTSAEREALALTEAVGCSFSEAAQVCQCSTVQFKARLTVANANLARVLSSSKSLRSQSIEASPVKFSGCV